MKPVLVTSGEPSGIGPDICLQLAYTDLPVVVLGDKKVMQERADLLNLTINFKAYTQNDRLLTEQGCLSLIDIPCPSPVVAGQLSPVNAKYVLEMLTQAAAFCESGTFSAVATAPVHKGIINQAGIPFTGHTEFFAEYFSCSNVVMLLACEAMKVALVTTHIPLHEVPQAISEETIIQIASQLHQSLKQDFAIKAPRIAVAGLNPHAGENGFIGREEIDVIAPALQKLRHKGIEVVGPLSADTLFSQSNLKKFDVFLTMYHDQGLPVIKYASFGQTVNVTMGLPIIRTSVDHGTALELAGTGKADSQSLIAAIKMAAKLANNREKGNEQN